MAGLNMGADAGSIDLNIFDPNPAIGDVFASDRLRSIVFEVAELAQALYVDRVAKRTGRLAATARASTEFAHVIKGAPRWVGELTVGGTGRAGSVDYAAPHEFGTRREVEGPVAPHTGEVDAQGNPIHNRDDRVITGGHHAAHDLNYVLGALG
jgi:hypothetical protein